MGLDQLRAFLRKHRRIGLDSSVFIYQVEPHPRYAALTDHIFAWLEHPDSHGVTSTITMTEVLVLPHKTRNTRLVETYQSLLSTYPNLEWVPPDLDIAAVAARLRAAHNLKTPDALQAATALRAGVTAFVTNDPVFDRVTEFETLVLERLLGGAA